MSVGSLMKSLLGLRATFMETHRQRGVEGYVVPLWGDPTSCAKPRRYFVSVERNLDALCDAIGKVDGTPVTVIIPSREALGLEAKRILLYWEGRGVRIVEIPRVSSPILMTLRYLPWYDRVLARDADNLWGIAEDEEATSFWGESTVPVGTAPGLRAGRPSGNWVCIDWRNESLVDSFWETVLGYIASEIFWRRVIDYGHYCTDEDVLERWLRTRPEGCDDPFHAQCYSASVARVLAPGVLQNWLWKDPEPSRSEKRGWRDLVARANLPGCIA